MSIPLTQVSSSEAQLSMQAIQETLCHLGINSLLLKVKDSSQTSDQSPHSHQEVSDQAIPRSSLVN
jgi:hypothetical protein